MKKHPNRISPLPYAPAIASRLHSLFMILLHFPSSSILITESRPLYTHWHRDVKGRSESVMNSLKFWFSGNPDEGRVLFVKWRKASLSKMCTKLSKAFYNFGKIETKERNSFQCGTKSLSCYCTFLIWIYLDRIYYDTFIRYFFVILSTVI